MLRRPLRGAAMASSRSRALSVVPHAFPNHPYKPEKKAHGTTQGC
jgi:hypothetical protein